MKKELVDYKSQIIKKEKELIIHLKPFKGRLLWFQKNTVIFSGVAVFSILGLIITMKIGFLSEKSIPFFIAFGFVSLLATVYIESRLSKITINKNTILTNDENNFKSIRNIPFIDFEVEILENRIKISMQGFEFNLKNVRDLPKLTEGVAELLDLEFYDNYQLQNNKEVLTYKAKSIVKPNFPSFLIIKNLKNKLQIHDIRSQYSYIKIEKKSRITDIIYSVPTDIEERDGTESKIERVMIQKIVIEIHQDVGILENQHRIIVKAVMKNLNRNYEVNLLKTKLKNSKAELTNFRDGERIYDLLKNLRSLNISIEKKVVN